MKEKRFKKSQKPDCDREDNWWRKYTCQNRGGERPEYLHDYEMRDPFAEIERMTRKMNSIFSDINRRMFGPHRGLMEMGKKVFRAPNYDIRETKNEIICRIELPGVDKRNIRIKTTDNALIVDAQAREEHKNEREGFASYSSSYSGFRRVIPLPARIVKQQGNAKYENGILTIRLKKAEPDEGPSDIEIE